MGHFFSLTQKTKTVKKTFDLEKSILKMPKCKKRPSKLAKNYIHQKMGQQPDGKLGIRKQVAKCRQNL